jgi:GNAT superfamily N-acetyltransferase
MSYEQQARQWSSIVRDHTQSVIVASEAADGVVGFVGFGPARVRDRPATGPFAGEAEAKVAEVYTLYVLPDFQERGIGRQLLAAVFATLVEKRCTCCFLWALRDNHARYFYERVGGKLVAERRESQWGRRTDQVCYGWPDLAQVTVSHSR